MPNADVKKNVRLVCIGGPKAREIVSMAEDRYSIEFLIDPRRASGKPASLGEPCEFTRVRYTRHKFAEADVLLYERVDPTQMLEILLRSYADADIGDPT